MSLSVALQNALSGLQANESIIQVISNNVTNANTEGYTRKAAVPVSRTLDAQGRGVEIGNIARVVDERLLTDLRRNLASLGDARAQDFYYRRILDQFGTLSSNSSLTAGLTDLATNLQNMAATPESTTHRAEVVTAAVALAQQLNAMSTQVQTLRFDADKEITSKIDLFNGELEKIADLNRKIEAAQAVGDPTAELEDFRDQAINKISELIDVRYFKRKSGEIVVTLPDGKVLADKKANRLSHTAAGALSADISYPGKGITAILSGGTDVTLSIASGELKGLIEVRDTILPNLQAELDLLTQTLRDELNALHNAGTGRPPPNTLTGTRTFAAPSTDTITLSGATRIAAVDANGNFVAHFDLAAGTYTIQQIESQIDTNLSGFATASTSLGGPLSISATNSANGIAVVDLGAQTVTHVNGAKFSGFSNYFGLNDLFVTPGRIQGDPNPGLAALIQVRSDIVSDPARLSRGTLSAVTTPAPKAGDPAIAAGDASIAQALADKFIENLQFTAAGNLAITTTTLAGYASDILSTNAVGAAVAEKAMSFREALSQELSFRTQEVSGVNIDEELRNLVLYENAYGATARIVQVVDDLFELLINIGR
ncbi:MAG: flagellar hook-associated protein FlgK [Kiloniellaceae bacterium]